MKLNLIIAFTACMMGTFAFYCDWKWRKDSYQCAHIHNDNCYELMADCDKLSRDEIKPRMVNILSVKKSGGDISNHYLSPNSSVTFSKQTYVCDCHGNPRVTNMKPDPHNRENEVYYIGA